MKDKEYHTTKSKEHYWANKESYQFRCKLQRDRTRLILDEAKSNGCLICDETDLSCLDFHHLSDKDQIVSTMLGMSDKKVRNEIAKCVVLCANCHRKLHAGKISLL